MQRQLCTLALVLGLLVPALAATSDRKDDVQRIQAATTIFQQIQSIPEQAIPTSIIGSAQCIAIIPGQKKFALGIGGTYGKGLVTCKNGASWSAPLFITLGGGSWGFQIGGQSSDVVMIFRTREGVSHLLGNKFKIGADASAAAGPVGRNASASTDAALHAQILTYARSRGAFAGVSLNGAVVQPDDTGNAAMYGSSSHQQQILGGHVPPPTEALPLLRAVASATQSGKT